MDENKNANEQNNDTDKKAAIKQILLLLVITIIVASFVLYEPITKNLFPRINENNRKGAANFFVALTKDAPECSVFDDIDINHLTTINIYINCKADYECVVATIHLIDKDKNTISKYNIAETDCKKGHMYHLNHTFTLEEIAEAEDARCYISYYR